MCVLFLCSAIEHFVRKRQESVNITKDDGYMPLHLAALNDHLDVVTALAEMVSHLYPVYLITSKKKIGHGNTQLSLLQNFWYRRFFAFEETLRLGSLNFNY